PERDDARGASGEDDRQGEARAAPRQPPLHARIFASPLRATAHVTMAWRWSAIRVGKARATGRRPRPRSVRQVRAVLGVKELDLLGLEHELDLLAGRGLGRRVEPSDHRGGAVTVLGQILHARIEPEFLELRSRGLLAGYVEIHEEIGAHRL